MKLFNVIQISVETLEKNTRFDVKIRWKNKNTMKRNLKETFFLRELIFAGSERKVSNAKTCSAKISSREKL